MVEQFKRGRKKGAAAAPADDAEGEGPVRFIVHWCV